MSLANTERSQKPASCSKPVALLQSRRGIINLMHHQVRGPLVAIFPQSRSISERSQPNTSDSFSSNGNGIRSIVQLDIALAILSRSMRSGLNNIQFLMENFASKTGSSRPSCCLLLEAKPTGNDIFCCLVHKAVHVSSLVNHQPCYHFLIVVCPTV